MKLSGLRVDCCYLRELELRALLHTHEPYLRVNSMVERRKGSQNRMHETDIESKENEQGTAAENRFDFQNAVTLIGHKIFHCEKN